LYGPRCARSVLSRPRADILPARPSDKSACSCDDNSDDNGDDNGNDDDDNDDDDDDDDDNNGYASINVKPEEVGSGNPQGFDFNMYPRGGDLSITKSRREGNHNLDHCFLPGGGDFDNFLIFLKKYQNPHPMPNPPFPLRLYIDRCIIY